MNHKLKQLENSLAHFERITETNAISHIEIHEVDGRKHGIGNASGIKAMMTAAIEVLRFQIEKEKQICTHEQ